jgi:hypothetical protein
LEEWACVIRDACCQKNPPKGGFFLSKAIAVVFKIAVFVVQKLTSKKTK